MNLHFPNTEVIILKKNLIKFIQILMTIWLKVLSISPYQINDQITFKITYHTVKVMVTSQALGQVYCVHYLLWNLCILSVYLFNGIMKSFIFRNNSTINRYTHKGYYFSAETCIVFVSALNCGSTKDEKNSFIKSHDTLTCSRIPLQGKWNSRYTTIYYYLI